MKLEKWLTLLTNLAVIASLLFLALQLRQNNELIRLEALKAMSDSRRELVLNNMNNESLILARARAERGEELTELEQTQITQYFFATFRSWQDQFFSYQAGAYTAPQINSEAQTWRRTINNVEHVRQEWVRFRAEFAPEFVDFVESQE